MSTFAVFGMTADHRRRRSAGDQQEEQVAYSSPDRLLISAPSLGLLPLSLQYFLADLHEVVAGRL